MKPPLFLRALTVLALTPFSLAQLSTRGEFSVATDLSLTATDRTLTDILGLTLRGLVEADYTFDPVDFRLVLEPSVHLAGGRTDNASAQPGLTEVFALYRLGDVDLSAGLERLPLETARLSVPFRLEPVGDAGRPLGLLGARASIFLDDWRVRPALVYRFKDDQLGGGVSVRRTFGDFELEAHALYLDGFTAGLGGSGLLGSTVLYGEAWLLEPWDGRGTLGWSGFWGDLLWTAEAAYAPNPAGPGGAYPQLLGQFSLPQGDAGSWDLNIGLGWVDRVTEGSSLEASSSLLYTHTERDVQLTTGVTFSHTEPATVYGLRFGFTEFF